MKLASAICLALAATSSHAVYLNPHGTGQALLYPYYTVNGGNSTLLSLVNTTGAGKAVKVRFLEAHNGRSVFDVDVYLSPFDTWVAQVIPLGAGAGLFTNDNTCTVPPIPSVLAADAVAFRTTSFDGTAQSNDGGPVDASRVREGWIEAVEMGEVTNASRSTLLAIEHTSGLPKNCGQVVNAWNDYWKADSTVDLSSPTGGLSGSALVLNVDRGTVEAYRADALAQFYAPDSAPEHTPPGIATPNLASGTSKSATVFADDGILTTPFSTALDAVSSVFMASSITNEYIVSAAIGATTEWVLTLPTKPFYTDPARLTGMDALSPFDAAFTSGKSCSPITYSLFNREEGTLSTNDGFPEQPNNPQSTCSAAQVVAFNQPNASSSAVLGSPVLMPYTSPFQSGWLHVDFSGTHQTTKHRIIGTNGNVFYGLPVAAFSVTQFINGTLTDQSGNQVLSNYTSLVRHQSSLACDRGNSSEPCS